MKPFVAIDWVLDNLFFKIESGISVEATAKGLIAYWSLES